MKLCQNGLRSCTASLPRSSDKFRSVIVRVISEIPQRTLNGSSHAVIFSANSGISILRSSSSVCVHRKAATRAPADVPVTTLAVINGSVRMMRWRTKKPSLRMRSASSKALMTPKCCQRNYIRIDCYPMIRSKLLRSSQTKHHR